MKQYVQVTCAECNATWDRRADHLTRWSGLCRKCSIKRSWEAGTHVNGPTRRPRTPRPTQAVQASPIRRCTGCQQDKPVADFPPSPPNGPRYSHCRSCKNQAERSRAAARRAAGTPARPPPDPTITTKRCHQCQQDKPVADFYAREGGGHRDSCCKACRLPLLLVRSRTWAQAHPATRREISARRRAREKNAPVIERLDRQALLERDHYTCYLCGKQLDPATPFLHPDAVTLDHVIPLAKGGSHTADNLRVACRACNGHKSANLLPADRDTAAST